MSTVDDKRIEEITGIQLGTERIIRFRSPLFADCTGDGTVATQAGYEFMKAPSLMGSSLLISAVDIGRPAPFMPPPWAHMYTDESELRMRHHAHFNYGYYWLELGSPYDTVAENETIRDVLLAHVYGVWDHIKNHCTVAGVREKAATHVLDWVGMVPGKRESRRIVGDYVFPVDDIRTASRHFDDVCYGGWYVDLHTDGGILATGKPPNPIFNELPDEEKDELILTVYPIPYRSLYARDVTNLFIPGRHFSADRKAFGSARVQLTTAMMGEAAGAAAWLCSKYSLLPADISKDTSLVNELQRALTRFDVFIPGRRDDDPGNLAGIASASASSVFVYPTPGAPGETVTWDGPLGLVVPAGSKPIERAEVWVETGAKETTLDLRIEALDDIWDNQIKYEDEAMCTAKRRLAADYRGWVSFPAITGFEPKVLRLILRSDVQIRLGCSRPLLPGFILQTLDRTRWHSRIDARKELSVPIRLSPEPVFFGPEQAINGWSRPVQTPNLWISDPGQSFPQWLELRWSNPVTVGRVILLFDNNLHKEHRLRPGLYRAPECARDYQIEASVQGSWRPVWETRENYVRRNECVFPPVETDRLRIVVERTNGDPSARIYEIKVYGE